MATTYKRVLPRAARSDGSVGSMSKTIEENFKLPSGSVLLVRPDGRKVRSDASIESFRKSWAGR